ncbi:MAG TPA: SDR family oxidoreductase [Streptosporangiaceae bacterium]|jgi:3-oxoacyl-[acyl-carrier protein] reductase
MDLGLQDRVYVVTGGSRGLGRACADALVAEGARVVVAARDADAVRRAAEELGTENAAGVAADNADPAAPARLIATARERFGRVDGALISVGGPPGGATADITDDQWHAAFDSVFLGAVRIATEVAAAVGDGGSLAFILSSSVRVPLPGLAISNGLRPGLAGVAKTMANELGPRGIRVNTLIPGSIATDRLRELATMKGQDYDEVRRKSEARIPLGRYGDPAEMGRVAAFVLSPAASYVTGSTINVDGGIIPAI